VKPLSVTAAVLAVLLCAAASAQAKGVSAATVCGADGCRDITDQSRLQFFSEGGPPTDPPSTASGWYRVTVTIGAPGAPEDRFTMAVVTDQRLIRGSDGTWMPVSPDAVAAYRSAARGLEPLPPSGLGLKPSPAPDAAPSPDGGGDVPWVLLVLGAAVCLGAIALTPPVRRRFSGPQSSS
jgi:hypothetical protein